MCSRAELVPEFEPDHSHGVARVTGGITERIQAWRQTLLKDMTHLPTLKGQKPGRIVVQGENAAPLVNGLNNEHVVMAASEVGERQGRVVVLSHQQYLRDFGSSDLAQMSILHENLNQWATKGAFASDQHIVDIGDAADGDVVDLSDAKIVIWRSPHESSKQMEKLITDHVINGGALLYALCPHSWKSKNPKKETSEMPLGEFLLQAGISFCPSKVPISHPGQGFSVAASDSDTLHFGHAHHLIEECCQADKTGPVTLEQAMMFANFFKDVPPKVVQHLKDKLDVLFRKCHQTVIHSIPQSGVETRKKHQVAAIIICNVISDLGLGYKKMPGIEYFPGDLAEADADSLQCAEFDFESTQTEAHSTGYWVPAGQTIQVEVISDVQKEDVQYYEEEEEDDDEDIDDGDGAPGWTVRIGAHSDQLYKKPFLYRWPKIVTKSPLNNQQQEIFTPYGGLLYFESPNGKSSLKVKVSGVVEAPYFDLRDPSTVRRWHENRHAPGVWADMAGEWFRVTVPSKSVRHLDNPTEVLQRWDQVVKRNHDLRGTEVVKRQWAVADVQPVLGLMHSGYPIVTGMNVADPDNGALSLERMSSQGFWGIFHELGHNMQRKVWTFTGTIEVTCNVFALYQSEMIVKDSPFPNPWFDKHMDKIRKYVRQEPDFSKWQNQKGVALAFYAQLAHHFEWESYKKVFRGYEAIPMAQQPKQLQAQVDAWILRFSSAVDHSLAPLADFWGLPMSPGVRQKLSALTPFLPDDHFTQMATDARLQAVISKYTGLARVYNKT